MNNVTTTGRKALVVGCGIAGPVLATFLRRAGITPVVYEGRSEPGDEAGAFLNLLENGLDVLGTLGIKEEIEGYGTPTTGMVFTNHRGKRFGEMPQYATLLKRGLLNKGLREAAIREGVAINFGKRLEDVEVTPRRGVIARFEDGSEAGGDLLVGCGGINSQTRRTIMPDAPDPAYTGVIGCGDSLIMSPASLHPTASCT
jgi:2-polyprenyl-6-methoxyphenol hydroxylase-like FAD-dependent oxidoreductase